MWVRGEIYKSYGPGMATGVVGDGRGLVRRGGYVIDISATGGYIIAMATGGSPERFLGRCVDTNRDKTWRERGNTHTTTRTSISPCSTCPPPCLRIPNVAQSPAPCRKGFRRRL